MDNQINFMDLKRQFQMFENEYMEAVLKVCRETAFAGGTYVADFEKEFSDYCNVKETVGVSNGTSGLFLGMKALGIGPGDEVLVPANTFIATAWGVSHNGAVPVFVDIDPDTFEIDPSRIKEKITSRTKAVVGVHLYGQPFDVDSVKEIAQAHGLQVIEDCAQAHGALYKGRKIGGLGDIGCFSFYPGKNLGSFGEAGAVVSNSLFVIDQIRILKDHGAKEKYHHDTIGYNMRMEGIQGAILSCKLKHLDGWNNRRKDIAHRYQEGITNHKIKMQKQPAWSDSVYHLFEIEADDRYAFMEHMKASGIFCSMHYPVPCHLQKAYSSLGYQNGDLPCAEYHAEHCVTLPMFPELTDLEVERVIEACNQY